MASLDHINQLLTIAASLIDRAASEIREAKLEPVRENIAFMARALAEVFELQHRIYARRPDLTADLLIEPSQYSAANRSLTEIMLRASELELAGNIDGAVAEFERFLRIDSSPLHVEIAQGEIERLRNAACQ